LGWALYPALRLQYQTGRRVSGLEQQYDSLRKRNEQLRSQVADLQTPQGVEHEAEKLGLAKRGEHVYVVVGGKTTTGTAAAAGPGTGERSAIQVILDAVFGVEEVLTPDRAP
jgi:hypothetical protein